MLYGKEENESGKYPREGTDWLHNYLMIIIDSPVDIAIELHVTSSQSINNYGLWSIIRI